MSELEAPIYGYNHQYFRLHPKYTKKELYALQSDVLVIISEISKDIEKDLNSKMDRFYVLDVLRQCYIRKLVERERLGVELVDGKSIPVHRYFTK